MSLLTLAQAKTSRLKEIANSCPDSDDFLSLVNDATRMLMRRGNFWGTVQKIQICTYNGCITWPRYVGTVIATNLCGNPIPIWNNWYSFEPIGPNDFLQGGFSFANGTCTGNIVSENDGVTPVFNPIPCGHPNTIRVFVSARADIGLTTTIYGIDENGQTIRTRRSDGSWQEGVVLTLTSTYVETPFKIASISRISKDSTQGVVRYYQWDSDQSLLLDLVSYDPSETEPSYRRTRIKGIRQGTVCNSNACGGIKSITALVKLEFIPVALDADLILIPNVDALKDMIMSIKEKENGNLQGSLVLETSAVHELNLEMRDKFPNTQIPVNVMPYGTARLSRQGIGTLI